MMRDKGIRFLESFLCGGTSALLISVAHLHSEFWFLSLIALVPFLWWVVGRVPSPPQADKKPDNGIATFLSRVGRGLVSHLIIGGDKPRRYAKQVGRVLTRCRRGKTRHVTTRVLTYMVSKLREFRPTNAVIPGMMLATCYVLVAYPTELWTMPEAFLLKLFALNLIFSVYAIVVSRLKKRLGFNAIFIAALWLPLEYALSHHAGLGSLFAFSTTDSALVYRIGSLFGMLMISFVIVLVNSLILIVLKRVAQALLSSGTLLIKEDKRPHAPFKEIILERRWYYFPIPRAPPIRTCRSGALRS